MPPRHKDALTPDLFEVPAPRAPLPGALDCGLAVRRLLSDAIRASGHTAAQIAAQMSELIGASVSEHMLHAWCAPSRDAWRFPLEYLPAFEAAAETHAITAWLADTRGGRLYLGRDALRAELGRLEAQRDELARLVREIKRRIGEEGE